MSKDKFQVEYRFHGSQTHRLTHTKRGPAEQSVAALRLDANIEFARLLVDGKEEIVEAPAADPRPVNLNTRDIGFLIRDMVEGYKGIIAFVPEADDDELDEKSTDIDCQFIDVSDPHNPKIHLSNGQVFTIRIIAGERA